MQTELSNTLKRRKPVAIVDPPKYQYPTSLDVNKADENIVEPIKPVNVNHTLAVVSTIKLIDGVNINVTPKTTTNDKPMITHAKPNFTLSRKKSNNAPLPPNGLTPEKMRNTSEVSITSPKIKTIIQLNNGIATVQGVPVTSTQPPPLPIKLPPIQSNAADLKKSTMPNETIEGRKLLMSHGKPNFVAAAKTQQQFTPKNHCNQIGTKEIAENYLDVKIKSLKPQRSISNSSSCRIAEKKAIFEQPSLSIHTANVLKPLKSKENNNSTSANSNEIHRALNRLRSTDGSKDFQLKSLNFSGQTTPHSDSSNDSGHSSPLPQTSAINKSTFEKHVTDAVNKNISNGQGHSISNTTNFEQRTVVSFAKELNDAPNRYPEHVRITKKITSNTETMTSYRRQEAIFDNIRFSINDQAQVIHKLKQ